MINILAYLGMNIQSEVCLWTLLGLLRTIFDATLFKMNANLKQVWQMTMPLELSMPVQRALRTMISGVMLVQCFTVYVYLASYIVLLYPVFLEERPTLVLPWLLLAAIRKLLCELTSLALGLGTCVLLGPAKPPCIKFVIVKVVSIMPAFYMWMLVFSYYRALKVAAAFKTFPAVLPSSDHDYGLELAVRRRCTKSLLDEEQLRKKLVANYYGDRSMRVSGETTNSRPKSEISSRMAHSTDMSFDDFSTEIDILRPTSTNMTQSYEDWSGSEIVIPRDTDRILEQFVLMSLRIGAYLKTEGMESINNQILSTSTAGAFARYENLDGPVLPTEDTDTPSCVGSKGNTASYLLEYPHIFNRKLSTDLTPTENKPNSLRTVQSQIESTNGSMTKSRKRVVAVLSDEAVLHENQRKIKLPREKNISEKKLQTEIEVRIQDLTHQTLEDKNENVKLENADTSQNSEYGKMQEREQEDNNGEPELKDKTIITNTKNRGSENEISSKEDKNKETNGASTSRTRAKRK